MKIIIFILLIFLPVGLMTSLNAQQKDQPTSSIKSDSLSLADVLQTVIKTHPGIKQAEEALNAAEARVSLAKTGYMPDVDITGSYSRIAPVTKFNFPGFGTVQLFPENNYVAALNYRQNIYDFGKTSNAVKLENENKNLLSKNIDLARQKLALAATNTYYSILFLQNAIVIKNEELKTLNEHLEFIQKRNATGSATKYELLATKVKISNTESQKTDLLTVRNTQMAVLNSLMGQPVTNVLNLSNDLNCKTLNLAQDSLLSYALSHRVELAIAKEKETMLTFQYNVVKSQNNPVINAFASGGGKNGYMPDINKIEPNFSIGLGLRIPIFDGNRTKHNLTLVKSSITNSGYETELSKRSISNEVIENEANRTSALQKMQQYELQLDQAMEAFSLAKVNFTSGAVTNLDMLDAETAVSESKLLLLKSRIDYIVSVYKLKTALGDNLF